MAKKITLASLIIFAFAFLGCQQVSDQAAQIRGEAQKKINDIQVQYDTAASQVMETKAKIDQKVEDVQNAATAVQGAVSAVGKIGQ